MAETKDYSTLVKRAEEAVQGIKDPDLKRVAFEKVLDDLLSPETGSAHSKLHTDNHVISKEPKKKVSKRKTSGLAAYLDELLGEKFFASPKTISDVKEELENRGHHIPLTSLSGPMQNLCKKRKLRRQKTKKTDGKGKQTFTYSNW